MKGCTNMKNLIAIVTVIMAVVIFTGCVSTTKEIQKRSTSARMDVFVENPEGIAPVGFVDLLIKASDKTRLEGQYASESNTPGEGKQGFPFLVNIDGQAVLWTVDGQRETTPFTDADGYLSRDPDAGAGIKYRLEKKGQACCWSASNCLRTPNARLFVGVQSVFERCRIADAGI